MEQNTKENGMLRRIAEMEKVNRSGQMVPYMKVIGKMIKQTARED
jgi:hypothetical protein